VVPLHDVLNQSGITTLLEAMSMGRPVVVTASRGQRESVEGPLIRADGTSDPAATSDRGPAVFGDAVDSRQTGYYSVPGDSASLRAAIQAVLADPATAATIGQAARDSIEAHFTLERYVNELSGLLSNRLARSPVALETQPT
jgi:glycosyltransferase involved in cell wall biosynthesis